ncbi:MAG: hypothetical protein CML31_01620 [Rhizobiales bacterium]|nr:hypothetical protein [Hyphomicrobiales bacterium]|tara:strand:- start:887 stop:1588 length:702 start_codon:yes stop_codon:yes gene_type:complete
MLMRSNVLEMARYATAQDKGDFETVSRSKPVDQNLSEGIGLKMPFSFEKDSKRGDYFSDFHNRFFLASKIDERFRQLDDLSEALDVASIKLDILRKSINTEGFNKIYPIVIYDSHKSFHLPTFSVQKISFRGLTGGGDVVVERHVYGVSGSRDGGVIARMERIIESMGDRLVAWLPSALDSLETVCKGGGVAVIVNAVLRYNHNADLSLEFVIIIFILGLYLVTRAAKAYIKN